jgi:hypothetical protein
MQTTSALIKEDWEPMEIWNPDRESRLHKHELREPETPAQ